MQLEKVRRFIIRNQLFSEGEAVVVAVSGGPDSLCLLHMLQRLSSELKLRLVVAHLNHCLRPEALQEAEGVEKISSAWSLPFETKSVDIRSYKKEHGLSEEEAGRRARYRFLFDIAGRYGASTIALGHHLDDQAETVLLNVLRGSGVDGLAGILPKRSRNRINLVRPLLCLRRSEIEDYCRKNSLQPYTDSSNLETDYTRNKLRLELIPHLEERYNPRIREALFGLAALAAADRLFLTCLAQKKLSYLARISSKEIQLNRQKLLLLPSALRGRVLRLALQRYAPAKRISRIHIEQLLDLAENGRTGKQLNLPGGIRACNSYDRLVLIPAFHPGEEKLKPVSLRIPGTTVLPGGTAIGAHIAHLSELDWPPPSYRACLDYNKLSGCSLSVRLRRPGDRFYPQGAPGSKKLKAFLIDQKIPLYRREFLPLVTSGDEIIWIAGIRIAHPYRVTEQTKEVLVLDYKMLKPSRPGIKRKDVSI